MTALGVFRFEADVSEITDSDPNWADTHPSKSDETVSPIRCVVDRCPAGDASRAGSRALPSSARRARNGWRRLLRGREPFSAPTDGVEGIDPGGAGG